MAPADVPQLDLAPAWMVALIIGREFAITGLRSLAYTKGITMPASPHRVWQAIQKAKPKAA